MSPALRLAGILGVVTVLAASVIVGFHMRSAGVGSSRQAAAVSRARSVVSGAGSATGVSTPARSLAPAPSAVPPAAPPGPPPLSGAWLAKHPSPDLGVHGQAVVLADVGSKEVLWQRDPTSPRAPASLTKLVTAMVAADLAQLDQKVTVSGSTDMAAVQKVEPASTVMGLTAGEVLTLRELMYGLFLRSGNDAAETMAAGIVDRDRFIRLMNEKAAALGMRSSHFTTPIGLDDPGMRSTAYDLAVAAATIVTRYPELLAISGTPGVTIPQTASHKQYTLENYNKLVLAGPLNFPGATGMKTAFTDDAGPCMVASARRGNRRLVAVVLNSDNFFADAGKLLTYGFGVPI
jgi:serine-type D-Ala-D-Ala carboxypeptidase (penicillin-binding protein 5/6)